MIFNIYLLHEGQGYLSRYSDSLRAGMSEDGILAGARFSVPVQTGPGAHPASNTMGTGYRPGRGVDHPPSSSAEVKERVELYLYSLFWAFISCSRLNFTFTWSIYRDFCWLPFGAGIIFLILAHSVYKMWVIQEPNKLALWNKLHFEGKKTESIEHV